MTRSQAAKRLGLRNKPNSVQISNLTFLCVKVLEKIKILAAQNGFSGIVNVTSGYRSPSVNRAVKGSQKSQHIRGEAADINSPGLSTDELFEMIINSGIEFDQVIQEFDSWVHISFKQVGKNRKSVLYAWLNEDGDKVFTKTPPPDLWREALNKNT